LANDNEKVCGNLAPWILIVVALLIFAASFSLQRPPLAFAAAQGWVDGVKALLAVKEERKLNVDALDEQVTVHFSSHSV
jgi:hypothetical protein